MSLISGRAVYEALRDQGVRAFLLDPVGDFLTKLKEQEVDMVFIALHGSFGEDGTIQSILEEVGIPYTGCGVAASQLAFDKAKAQACLKSHHVLVPDFMVLKHESDASILEPLAFPMVVKPSSAGSSIGISIVKNRLEITKALKIAFEYSDVLLVDQYIPGRELTVGFLGKESLPTVEVKPARTFYDYEAKYRESGTRYEFPAKLSLAEENRVKQMAKLSYEALGCEVMGRVDLILSNTSKPYILEVNTIPGLTGKSLLPKAAWAAGISFSELCVRILDLSWQIRGVRETNKIKN